MRDDDKGALDATFLLFPKIRKDRAPLPSSHITDRCCIVCNHFGCVKRLITPEVEGGLTSGDNVLPVCAFHAELPIETLVEDYRMVEKWLMEHERIDVVLSIARKRRAR